MSKICPNCGYTDSDDAKTCHICGKPLVAENKPEDDFDYDFGGAQQQSQASDIDALGVDSNTEQNVFSEDEQKMFEQLKFKREHAADIGIGEEAVVPIKMSDAKANKMKKNLVSLTSSLTLICIIRFVLSFMDIDDYKEIQFMLPTFEGTEFYGVFKSIVYIYYASFVILALILVAAIIQFIFSYKANKYTFPVKDDGVFDECRKAFYVSIATAVLVLIYFIIEIVALGDMFKMQAMMDEKVWNITDIAVPLVIDIFLLVSAGMHLASALKLSKCKQA